MREIFHVICGRRFRVRYSNLRTNHGVCTDPGKPNPTITIAKGLDELGELETIIHESLHAAGYFVLSEEFVENAAHDIARLLVRLGFEKHGKG